MIASTLLLWWRKQAELTADKLTIETFIRENKRGCSVGVHQALPLWDISSSVQRSAKEGHALWQAHQSSKLQPEETRVIRDVVRHCLGSNLSHRRLWLDPLPGSWCLSCPSKPPPNCNRNVRITKHVQTHCVVVVESQDPKLHMYATSVPSCKPSRFSKSLCESEICHSTDDLVNHPFDTRECGIKQVFIS